MRFYHTLISACAVSALTGLHPSFAAISADEAAKLKTTLTPLGAEKAGNADGTIPAWTGGLVDPNYNKNQGRRDDLFANDKPLFSISAANMGQYADKLSEGVKALFAKYPESYRIDVYKTERTAAAPQWVYDNTLKNATSAKADPDIGLSGAYGGTPFPIPKEGLEVMWNHLVAWRGADFHADFRAYILTADGKHVVTTDASADYTMPFYDHSKAWNADYSGAYWEVLLTNEGPPIRAGEGLLATSAMHFDDDKGWIYLTGQRRVRRLPNACCDTPAPPSAGVMSFDEIQMFTGRTDRFDWKLVGKKELYVPYNSNMSMAKTDADYLSPHHVNPDRVRWELHRVYVVESTLRAGSRHVAPKSRYYIDEDSWNGMLGERWDGNGQLWKMMYQISFAAPDMPAQASNMIFGFQDLISGSAFSAGLMNEKAKQYQLMPHYPDTSFAPDALTAQGVR